MVEIVVDALVVFFVSEADVETQERIKMLNRFIVSRTLLVSLIISATYIHASESEDSDSGKSSVIIVPLREEPIKSDNFSEDSSQEVEQPKQQDPFVYIDVFPGDGWIDKPDYEKYKKISLDKKILRYKNHFISSDSDLSGVCRFFTGYRGVDKKSVKFKELSELRPVGGFLNFFKSKTMYEMNSRGYIAKVRVPFIKAKFVSYLECFENDQDSNEREIRETTRQLLKDNNYLNIEDGSLIQNKIQLAALISYLNNVKRKNGNQIQTPGILTDIKNIALIDDWLKWQAYDTMLKYDYVINYDGLSKIRNHYQVNAIKMWCEKGNSYWKNGTFVKMFLWPSEADIINILIINTESRLIAFSNYIRAGRNVDLHEIYRNH